MQHFYNNFLRIKVQEFALSANETDFIKTINLCFPYTKKKYLSKIYILKIQIGAAEQKHIFCFQNVFFKPERAFLKIVFLNLKSFLCGW